MHIIWAILKNTKKQQQKEGKKKNLNKNIDKKQDFELNLSKGNKKQYFAKRT